jgi:putative selenium metabolism protein SsnA
MLIINGTLITNDNTLKVFPNGAISIEKNLIQDLGKTSDLLKKYPDKEIIDAEGKIVMPGLINSHMHLYSTFASGLIIKDKPPKNFIEILKKLWWKLDTILDEKGIYFSALLPLINCIKFGTTSIIDHHSSPSFISGSLNVIAEASTKIGIRTSLCYETTDRNGIRGADEGIKENLRFIQRCKKENNPMLSALFGLHANLTLSDKTLFKCIEAVDDLRCGFHIHLSEDKADEQNSNKKYNLSCTKRLNTFGILNEKTVTAHCVHISKDDMKLLRKSHTNVVHNPRSNMNNAVGTAKIIDWKKHNIKFGLGTDGISSSMWDEFKTGILIHKIVNQNPNIASSEIIEALFLNNPVIASKIFNQNVGKLKKNYLADIVILDYYPPTTLSDETLISHLLFGICNAPVDTTIINGKVLMRNKELLYIDEQQIATEAQSVAKTLIHKL